MTVTAASVSTEVVSDQALDELVLVQRLENMYHYAMDKKKSLYKDWRQNWLLLNNRMWSQFRMAWMPTPSDSEIYPILANLIGWLTDQNVSFSVTAATPEGTPWSQYLEGLATDLQVLLQSNWKRHKQQHIVTLGMWDAALYGAGIFKAVWDQSLDKGMGDANFVRIDPWNFYADPAAHDEEDANYFFEIRRMSIDEIERRFPESAARLKSALLWNATDESIDSDSRPTNTRTGAQGIMSFSQGYPTAATAPEGLPGQGARKHRSRSEGVVVTEAWVRENRWGKIPDPSWRSNPANPNEQAPEIDVCYDDWRVVVFAARVVLLDAWASDLWDGATHPYARFVFEDTGEFWPTPVSNHMAPAQIAINRLLSALQQSAELTGNPIFVEPASAKGAQTLIVNRPGQRLSESPMASNTGGYRWLSPPQMSMDVMGLIRFWIERMENVAGLSQVSKGRTPAPRTPEAVVSQTQESGFIRVRSVLRNLEYALRRIGQIQAQLIVENYTVERTVSVLGPEGGKSAVALRSRHFLDAKENRYAPFYWSLIINAGSEVPTSRQARVSEAQNLYVIKGIDRPALLETVNFPNWKDINQRMSQAEQLQMELGIQERQARSKTGRRT